MRRIPFHTPVAAAVSRLAVVVSCVALAGAGLAAAAPAASAAMKTFTWSGADEAGGGSSNFSDSGNWSGGVAPASGKTVALVFPTLPCSTTGSCSNATNDLSELTVTTLKASGPSADDNGDPQGFYDLTGNGITLTKGASFTGTQGDVADFDFYIDVPLTLTGSQTWSLDSAQAVFDDAVSGGEKLVVKMSDEAGVTVNGAFSTGNLTFQGTNTDVPGSESFMNGELYVGSGGSLTTTSGKPLLAQHIDTYVTGSASTAKETGSELVLGGADTHYTGNLTLASNDLVYYANISPGSADPADPQHPGDYPQLQTDGSINLAKAVLDLTASCGQPVGATYTLVSAAGGLSGLFGDGAGGSVRSGQVVSAQPYDQCADGTSAPNLRIDYAAGAVTATVVGSQ